MSELILYPYNPHYLLILEYLYDTYSDKITQLDYINNQPITYYRYRQSNENAKIQTIIPHKCDFTFVHSFDETEIEFRCQLKLLYTQEGIEQTYVHSICHGSVEDRILKQLIIYGPNQYLPQLMDVAKEYIKDKHESQKKSTRDTIRIYYYQKEFWTLLSKSPKRPIDTLYLKQGEKDELLSKVSNFFDKDTRDLYLSYGMPYKHIIMLYGIPGSGKTSTISAVASHFDCDIYTIPITKQLTDYGLIDAFSDMNDSDDPRKRIIVLEDIDCIFDSSRKEGDEHNMITLQSLLNCLDGHTCVEGTLLFMTANHPEKMDYAMVRSCRIDYKLHLGYADEYQTRCIYETFLPNQTNHFSKFYKSIRHKQFTTAMLQEFLFYNRLCDNILDHMKQFMDIIDKNKPEELLSEKKDKSLYM